MLCSLFEFFLNPNVFICLRSDILDVNTQHGFGANVPRHTLCVLALRGLHSLALNAQGYLQFSRLPPRVVYVPGLAKKKKGLR